MKYEDLFKQADVVVIATPLDSVESDEILRADLDQALFPIPEKVRRITRTVATKFKIAFVLKGKLKRKTFHFLHLKRTDGKRAPGVGSIGTFFVDFATKDNQKKSFILFMKKLEKDKYRPAWNPLEGSRAIIPVQKEGTL
ncbi:MAG: hypothetical protein HQ515_23150 [Phycisphaeraceae bacterium]|nr:hypothetical protein [Phycisphaeraceae bacterium]